MSIIFEVGPLVAVFLLGMLIGSLFSGNEIIKLKKERKELYHELFSIKIKQIIDLLENELFGQSTKNEKNTKNKSTSKSR